MKISRHMKCDGATVWGATVARFAPSHFRTGASLL